MSKGTTLFLAFILIFTFPIWIGLLAGGFGIMMGIIGGIFGIVGSIMGTLFGAIGSAFSGIIGIFDWGWGSHHFLHPHIHYNKYVFLALIITIALVISKRRQRS